MIEINFGILSAQVVTFLIGVWLVWKIAWGPLTQMLKERSSVIERDLETAEQKRTEAQKLEESYREQLVAIEAKTEEITNRALQEAQTMKEQILKSAQDESKKLMEKTKESLEAERVRLIGELQRELSHWVVVGAEKLLRQTIDQQRQEQWTQQFLAELGQQSKKE